MYPINHCKNAHWLRSIHIQLWCAKMKRLCITFTCFPLRFMVTFTFILIQLKCAKKEEIIYYCPLLFIGTFIFIQPSVKKRKSLYITFTFSFAIHGHFYFHPYPALVCKKEEIIYHFHFFLPFIVTFTFILIQLWCAEMKSWYCAEGFPFYSTAGSIGPNHHLHHLKNGVQLTKLITSHIVQCRQCMERNYVILMKLVKQRLFESVI